MRHKRNKKKNKSHGGRKILLSKKDIALYVDNKPKNKPNKMYNSLKELFGV